MKKEIMTTLNMTYFNKYHMSYDLIATFFQKELNNYNLIIHHFNSIDMLLESVKEDKIDIVIINASCLFDGFFRENEIKKILKTLCENTQIITIFFAQNMNAALLKKMVNSGISIIISSQDTPQELLAALENAMTTPKRKPYVSKVILKRLQQEHDVLTMKEWEVINMINQGYSLSEIASKKCRAMSTISTQKRNAMNKLHLKNESELLRFLQQQTFF